MYNSFHKRNQLIPQKESTPTLDSELRSAGSGGMVVSTGCVSGATTPTGMPPNLQNGVEINLRPGAKKCFNSKEEIVF